MGRNKIKIQKIENDRMRVVTFNKRKKGLIKKTMELSLLCDINILLCISEGNNKCTIYESSNDYIGFINSHIISKEALKKNSFLSNKDFDSFNKETDKDGDSMLSVKRKRKFTGESNFIENSEGEESISEAQKIKQNLSNKNLPSVKSKAKGKNIAINDRRKSKRSSNNKFEDSPTVNMDESLSKINKKLNLSISIPGKKEVPSFEDSGTNQTEGTASLVANKENAYQAENNNRMNYQIPNIYHEEIMNPSTMNSLKACDMNIQRQIDNQSPIYKDKFGMALLNNNFQLTPNQMNSIFFNNNVNNKFTDTPVAGNQFFLTQPQKGSNSTVPVIPEAEKKTENNMNTNLSFPFSFNEITNSKKHTGTTWILPDSPMFKCFNSKHNTNNTINPNFTNGSSASRSKNSNSSFSNYINQISASLKGQSSGQLTATLENNSDSFSRKVSDLEFKVPSDAKPQGASHKVSIDKQKKIVVIANERKQLPVISKSELTDDKDFDSIKSD